MVNERDDRTSLWLAAERWCGIGGVVAQRRIGFIGGGAVHVGDEAAGPQLLSHPDKKKRHGALASVLGSDRQTVSQGVSVPGGASVPPPVIGRIDRRGRPSQHGLGG